MLLFTWFLFCGITSLVLWSKTDKILAKEGKETNSFIVFWPSLFKFEKLIKSIDDEKKKRSYQTLYWTQLILIPVYIFGVFVILAYF